MIKITENSVVSPLTNEAGYAMRRTLSSKLLHLKVDRGVRQRILRHLEGTTIDRHYSDDGLQDLKDVLDCVDYGVRVGRVPKLDFPIMTGCNTPLLPSLDVEVSLSDEGELAGIKLLDADTDEILLAARIEGVTGPKNHAKQELPNWSAKDVADAIVALQANYSLSLPANDEAVAAIEHLLILSDPPDARQPDVAPVASSDADTGGIEIGPFHDQTSQPSLMHQADASNLKADSFRPGDTAVCVFPLAAPQRRRSWSNRWSGPALAIVGLPRFGRKV